MSMLCSLVANLCHWFPFFLCSLPQINRGPINYVVFAVKHDNDLVGRIMLLCCVSVCVGEEGGATFRIIQLIN